MLAPDGRELISYRIRRVKCDEAKPHCNRCTSTGRKCDGYQRAPASEPNQIIPATRRFPVTPIEPVSQLGSAEERESIHFFCTLSSGELAGFTECAFWQRQLLQATQVYPAIRHAVAGIGALHRKFIEGKQPAVPDDPSDKRLRFALQQSNKAIREILVSSSTKSLEDKLTMMTACILFDCLACLQGHQTVSIDHLRNGLRLLSEVEKELEESDQYQGQHPVSLASIRALFIARNVQARSILNNDTLREWEQHHPTNGFTLDQSKFKTFTEARTYFEALFSNLLALLQGMELNRPHASQRPAIMESFADMIEQFNAGSALLDEFLFERKANGEAQDDPAVLSIQLKRLHVRFFLSSFKYWDGIRELDWEVDETYFLKMLDLARQILRAEETLTRKSRVASPSDPNDLPSVRPVFTPGTEVCASLWTVSCRSRSYALRREAIALMRNYPRREGVWDSALAATIAEEAVNIEEAGAMAQYGTAEVVPKELRTRSFAITYVSLRSAWVEIKSMKQHHLGERGYSKYLQW